MSGLVCPNPDELSEFLDGRSADATAVEIEHHIATCRSCTDQLTAIDLANSTKRDADDFDSLQRLRQTTRSPGYEPSLKKTLELKFLYQPDIPAQVGRYELEDLIGQGSFGKVFAAVDPVLATKVAIKLVHLDIIAARTSSGDWLREVRASAQLRSCDGIVTVHDAGTIGRYAFIVSDFVEGPRLKDVISGGLPVQQTVEIAIGLADSLGQAHQKGIVHRDVKPSNILLQGERPFLVDFGLAFHMCDSVSGRLAGTVPYMSPEQLSIIDEIDHQTDIWSFGVVLYEMLAGQRPFKGKQMHEVREAVFLPLEPITNCPPELWNICQRCLTRPKSKRYASMAEVTADLKLARKQIARSGRSLSHSRKITPPGLHAFSEADSAAFIDLLPGAKDVHGVPLMISRWKRRIEPPQIRERQRGENVHYLYGPSGTGKSSFVRAALIPHLSDQTVAVFVRASARDLEGDLLEILRREFGCDTRDLTSAIMHLKKKPHLRDFKKLLIVVDQFEQWLAAEHSSASSLAQATMHSCAEIQWLFTVRDDFWMPLTNFATELDCPLAQGRNCEPIELMDRKAGYHALRQLGRWYGGLSSDSGMVSEYVFLHRILDDLIYEGVVNCARMACIAQILHRKDIWTLESLEEAGGVAELEIDFLTNLVGGGQAPQEYRKLLPAIQWCIQQLLPKLGSKVCENKLIPTDSPFTQETRARAINVLENELQLIARAAKASDSQRVDAPQCYRITHEFLAEAFRDWNARTASLSRRGRAQARLRQLSDLRELSKKQGQLPSVFEYAQLSLLTDSRQRTNAESELLQAGRKKAVTRVLTTLCGVMLLVLCVAHGLAHLAANRFCTDVSLDSFSHALDTIDESGKRNDHYFRTHAAEYFDHNVLQTRMLFGLASLPSPEANALVGLELPDLNEVEIMVACRWIARHRHEHIVAQELRSHPSLASNRRALVGFILGDTGQLVARINSIQSPDERTDLIHQLANLASVKELTQLLGHSDDEVSSVGFKSLAVASDMQPEWKENLPESLEEQILEAFQFHRNREVHACCELLLKRMGMQNIVHSAKSKLAKREFATGLAGSELASTCDWQVLPFGITLNRVEAGTYQIGSDEVSDLKFKFHPKQQVELTHNFLLGATPIEVRHFERLGMEVSQFKRSFSVDAPIQYIKRQTAMRFCNLLSAKAGMLEADWCYEELEDGGLSCKPNFLELPGYRLPTQVEWEIACRASSTTDFSFGNREDYSDLYGWFDGHAPRDFPNTGEKLPNRWGFFDMHGYIGEFCQDNSFDEPISLDAPADYASPATRTVIKNHSLFYAKDYCRSSVRRLMAPTNQGDVGFRICQSLIE